MLELIFNRLYATDEGAGGAPEQGKTSTDGTETNKTDTPESQESKPYKSFATEEEYQKELKSAESKAKHGILQKLGINSVDEGTQNLTKAEQLEKDLQSTVQRLQQLEEENALVRVGIQDDYKDEAITLARAKVNDKTNFETALKQVGEKFPNLLGAQKKGVEKVGSEGSEQNPKTGSEQLTEKLAKKYPWLKNK